ncbi:Uncharacterized protein FWK35_00016144 [Aphis craccivora]|uniref:Uncharacterized protein n=1 Tax=Aphis craccivora TaxID=307492 RepID=A0A6G0YX00_APHCR|nr:Uncharacterized protein FWK35_00016144 [Aphis craccivora]
MSVFGFRWKSEYPWCIMEVKSKNFPRVFKKSIFLCGLNLKTNHCKYLKFTPNVYNSVIYIHSNLYKICQNRENLQIKKSGSVKFQSNDRYHCIRKTILNGDDLSA